jgi:glutamyl/glutaminyl-tRNA synthetase
MSSFITPPLAQEETAYRCICTESRVEQCTCPKCTCKQLTEEERETKRRQRPQTLQI